MDAVKSLEEKRIDSFIRRLQDCLFAARSPLRLEYSLSEDPVPFPRRLEGKFRPIQAGQVWGRDGQSAWFRCRGVVPGEWKGRRVAALLNFSGEACLFSPDGTPLQGLTSGSVFAPHYVSNRIDLFAPCGGGEEVELWLEAAASGMFGLEQEPDPAPEDPRRYGSFEARVSEACLAVFREDIWHLNLDCRVLRDLMGALPRSSVRRARLLEALSRAADRFGSEPASVAALRERLRPELEKPAAASDLRTQAVGHAHIDTAWLWPLRETVRKCARTFSSQLRLLAQYPQYVFGASQPQLYALVKEHYPPLYEKIREAVAAGRWEPQGGMWVEADCNLTGGESLVRQILYGKLFFLQEFGLEVRNLWLPDAFGYSAALPQIMKKAGLEAMVTQKLSWNQINRFPYHTFRWQGIDGSEVLVHFPPEDTYNSELRADRLVFAQENFAEKGMLDEFLTLFGLGDGGGGPKEEFIEMGLRQRDLEGAPKVSFGPAREMLARLQAHWDRLPQWVGELYLELHRGTLTSQAANKKMNRSLEGLLETTETLCSCLPPDRYPAQDMEGMWKTLLLNQFHDILPGSAIRRVYAESQSQYRELQRRGEELLAAAAGELFEKDGEALCLFNPTSFPQILAVPLPADWTGQTVVMEDGQELPLQLEGSAAVALAEVPPLAARTLRRRKPGGAARKQLRAGLQAASAPGPSVLENALVRYEFGADGKLLRGWDREEGREILAGASNLLQMFEDRPVEWDAWEIDIDYERQLVETARLASASLLRGPVRQVLALGFRLGGSEIEQQVTLLPGARRLDFITRVAWREKHRLLRVAFSAAVQAQEAVFDIQFGTLARPNHRSTSWDRARFEAVGHRFADLCEAGYGVALLNDSKYGYKVLGPEISLSLLRSTTYPDPDADQGEHLFTYSLLPHRGDLRRSDVWQEASSLNRPARLFPGFSAEGFRFPLSWQSEGAVFEVLKKAEGESGWILRAYETRGGSARATLSLKDPGLRCFETDLMERTSREVALDRGRAELSFRPFEIRTFKLAP